MNKIGKILLNNSGSNQSCTTDNILNNNNQNININNLININNYQKIKITILIMIIIIIQMGIITTSKIAN